MSVQTGEVVPEGPASTRLGDRVRFRFDRLLRDPNPLWIRELRQSARLGRTPFILMGVTIFVTLIIAAVGGGMSDTVPSDQVGSTLFHTFFSLAYFVVAWVGPALAANAIASEREGRTWEALVLTGLRPQVVARGKFLAAYTAIGSYVVMLAPVGALCLLFGGVHPLEVAIAFLYLFVFALLSVAFGLAISSKMGSSRGAILLTLLLAVPLSFFVYGLGGPASSSAVHRLWERVPAGPPVWLPTAYVRGELGVEYFVLLFGLPAILVVLPAWFLYEATIANLAGDNDDRSFGLKRWYVVSALVLAATGVLALVAVPPMAVESTTVGLLVGLSVYGSFAAFVFAGEPPGPSRRVKVAWDRAGASALRRFFGPGLVEAGQLQLGVGLSAMAVTALVGIAGMKAAPAVALFGPPPDPAGLIRFSAYAVGFFAFTVGLGTWMRSRSPSVAGVRIMLVVLLLGLAIVPWIVAAVVGVFARGDKEAFALACPSPIYAFWLLDDAAPSLVVLAGWVASGAWAVAGFVMHGAATVKTRAVLAAFEARMDEADRVLREEEAALEAALAAAPPIDPGAPAEAFAPTDDAANGGAAPAVAGTAPSSDDEGSADPGA